MEGRNEATNTTIYTFFYCSFWRIWRDDGDESIIMEKSIARCFLEVTLLDGMPLAGVFGLWGVEHFYGRTRMSKPRYGIDIICK